MVLLPIDWENGFTNQPVTGYGIMLHRVRVKCFGRVWWSWSCLNRRGIIGQKPRFRYNANCIQLSPGTLWATVQYSHHNIVQLTRWKDNYFHNDHLFISLHSTEEWIQQNIDQDVTTNANLALHISNDTVIAVCDGSFYKNMLLEVWAGI